MAEATSSQVNGAVAEKQEIESEWDLPSSGRLKRVGSSFLRRLFMPRCTVTKEMTQRPTAWLDGLRGFAAFIVYWHHHELWSHSGTGQSQLMEHAYGYEGQKYFVSLPFVRNFVTGGHYAVATFFVISGYVLSAKSISLIHAGQFDKLAETLGSSLFRRWLRLYIPTYAITFLWMSSWHWFGLATLPFQPEGNYWDELKKWWDDFRNYSFIYRGGGIDWLYYNLHTWSIPFEFKGSIVVFTALLAFSKCTLKARMLCNAGLMFYGLCIVDGWFISMFVAGMAICELDILAAKNELPKFMKDLEPYKGLIYLHLFVFSLYLGGCPSASHDRTVFENSPGWYIASYFAPRALLQFKWFFLFWAATFMVAAVPRLPWLKSFFTTYFCQYLGKISFALYLVHGPMIWTLGDKVYQLIGWPKDPAFGVEPPAYFDRFHVPRIGPLGLELSFFLPQIILLPATLYMAALFTNLFDETSVKVSGWLYRYTLPNALDKQKAKVEPIPR